METHCRVQRLMDDYNYEEIDAAIARIEELLNKEEN